MFEAVRNTVTARKAADFYNIPVNRSGMACCPFHADKCNGFGIEYSVSRTGDKRTITLAMPKDINDDMTVNDDILIPEAM